jgi:hypothetical protein
MLVAALALALVGAACTGGDDQPATTAPATPAGDALDLSSV